MNALRLENINLHSPYRVWQTQEDSHYYFQTDTGIQYDIVFAPDTSIINSGAYTIDIVNRQHVASPVDMKRDALYYRNRRWEADVPQSPVHKVV